MALTPRQLEIRQEILAAVSDLSNGLLYYDRKNDDDLTVEDMTMAIEQGIVTQEEIVECFGESLAEDIEENFDDTKTV